MKTKYIRRICSLILVIVLIISAAIIPADAVSGVIDRNHKGSITLYMFRSIIKLDGLHFLGFKVILLQGVCCTIP